MTLQVRGWRTISPQRAALAVDGGPGNDLLIVLSGDNVYRGGAGLDTLDFSLIGGPVTVDLAVSTLQLFGGGSVTLPDLDIENVRGTSAADTLSGSSDHNVFDGLAGADTLVGRGGHDTYRADQTDTILELVGQGSDRIIVTSTYRLGAGISVEQIQTSNRNALASINLIGNELNQRLEGNSGNNILKGEGGYDILVGYGGSDTYFVDATSDQIIEDVGGGALDRVLASSSFTLAADDDVEYLATTNEAGTDPIKLVGNGLGTPERGNQILVGNAGDNILDGGTGDDLMRGLGGNDTYIVDSPNDYFVEMAHDGAVDRVLVSCRSYTLRLAAGDVHVEHLATVNEAATTEIHLEGNEIAQTIVGNAGANFLLGGGGADISRGLGGADTFAFWSLSDSGVTDATRDTIEDFDDVPGVSGDVISFLQMSGPNGGEGDYDYVFLDGPGDAFTADRQVRWYVSNGDTFVEVNDGGDMAADFSLKISGVKTLDASDFLL